MPEFSVGAPPELLKGDARDMQQLRHYLMQLCDALANTLNNLDGSNVRPGGLTSASFKNLSVEMLKAAKAEIGRAKIGWAQIQELEVQVAKICTATIETAKIDWAKILDLTVCIADIARARIRDADIDFAQIKDMVANKAIITQGVNGKLYVTDLAVTEANMVSLTTGALMVKGQDGAFYQITVTEDGAVEPVLVEVEGSNVAEGTIPGGKLIENTITARELNVEQIFANEAVMIELTANMGKFANLFTNEAVVGQLKTHLVETDYLKIKVGKDEIISAINMTEETARIQAAKIMLEGLVTANENFKVLLNGSIEALNANISGKITATDGSIGGWSIAPGLLHAGRGEEYVALSTAEAMYRIWAGAEAAVSAPFRVGRDGRLFASDAEISGKITATDGSIGGWNIAQGLLHAGRGEEYVALSNADAKYRIWAGAEAPSEAPFRVTRDGEAYLTKLYVTDENGAAQDTPVNLSTNYWKVNAAYAHAVKNMSVADETLTIELYNGESINFKKAGYSAAQLELRQSDPLNRNVFVYDTIRHTYNCQKTVQLYDTESNYLGQHTTINEISGTEAYEAGSTAGSNGVFFAASDWNAGRLTIKLSNAKQLVVSLTQGTPTSDRKIPVLDASSGATAYTVNAEAVYEAGRAYGRSEMGLTRDGDTVTVGVSEVKAMRAYVHDTHYVITGSQMNLTPGTLFTGPAGAYYHDSNIGLGGSASVWWE